MTDDRANIKIDRETFERLKAAKPEYTTWDGHLLDLLERAKSDP